jgi:putative dimethyl sulfoxide reductase chaperone
MPTCTAEERALARAALYRLLALAFAYPTTRSLEATLELLPVARTAATLIDERTARWTDRLGDALEAGADARSLEAAYQSIFTITYSEDCPPYETAYSASHIFEQVAQQADIAAFYRAFGVQSQAERPDHLAMEIEFCYLAAAKEAHARARGETDHVSITRDAQRAFLRDHLARWAPSIALRVAARGEGTPYAAAGRLLDAFVAAEERYLRLGRVRRFRDEPVLLADEPGDFDCPMDGAGSVEPAMQPLAAAIGGTP